MINKKKLIKYINESYILKVRFTEDFIYVTNTYTMIKLTNNIENLNSIMSVITKKLSSKDDYGKIDIRNSTICIQKVHKDLYKVEFDDQVFIDLTLELDLLSDKSSLYITDLRLYDGSVIYIFSNNYLCLNKSIADLITDIHNTEVFAIKRNEDYDEVYRNYLFYIGDEDIQIYSTANIFKDIKDYLKK